MKCNECGRTETARWYGKKTTTPICCSCYRKKYVAANPEKVKALQDKFNNSDKYRQKRKEYEKTDKGRKARSRADKKRYWSDPDKARSKNRTPEQKERLKKHYYQNKAYYTEKSIRRSRGLEVASLNNTYKEQTVEVYKNCPEGYEVDHIIPILGKDFRDGKREHVVCGLHVPWNLQYLPRFENRSKGCNLYNVEDI